VCDGSINRIRFGVLHDIVQLTLCSQLRASGGGNGGGQQQRPTKAKRMSMGMSTMGKGAQTMGRGVKSGGKKVAGWLGANVRNK
jgi:hypothetical protein